MNNGPETAAVQKRDVTTVEYVPYGAQDKIKLSVNIVQNLIAVRTKTGKTCSDRDAIKFLAMCQAKRLNPFEGDAFLIGYDGRDGASFSLITAHQTYLKRAELHPEFDGMRSGVIVKDDHATRDLEGDFFEDGQKVIGGWATVYFKNRKQPMHKRLRLARFQKPFGVWQDDPAGMICKCAEADALRSSFPTMLGGLYLREEIEIETLPKITKPDFTAATPQPLFSAPAANVEAAPQSEYVPNESEPGPETGENPNDSARQPENEDAPVKALRHLCKTAKVKEGELLEFLSATGSTDGSISTLEELAIQQPEVLAMVSSNANWGDIAKRIIQARKSV